MRCASLTVLAALTGCSIYFEQPEPPPEPLTEAEFDALTSGARNCFADAQCVIAYHPCEKCAIAINSVGAPEYEELASRVVCDAPPADVECPDEVAVFCDYGGICQLGDPPEPPWDGCNPVADTGCAAGEKCTWIIESFDPPLGRTDCAPDGTVTRGQPCVDAAVAAGGVDDCRGGLLCDHGVCTDICDQLENTNCDAQQTCVVDPARFTDANNAGLCHRACDPLDPVCEIGEGCYLDAVVGRSSCEQPSGPGTQGSDCSAIDGCAPGYGCVLDNDPVNSTGSVCAFFCDASAGGGPACADGPGPTYDCRSIHDFYGNTPDVPAAIGMCVDPAVWP
jgi:hypothetical protein